MNYNYYPMISTTMISSYPIMNFLHLSLSMNCSMNYVGIHEVILIFDMCHVAIITSILLWKMRLSCDGIIPRSAHLLPHYYLCSLCLLSTFEVLSIAVGSNLTDESRESWALLAKLACI